MQCSAAIRPDIDPPTGIYIHTRCVAVGARESESMGYREYGSMEVWYGYGVWVWVWGMVWVWVWGMGYSMGYGMGMGYGMRMGL